MTKKTSPVATRSKSISLLMLRDRTIAASDFKARCLEIMDEVERTGIEVTITKHRKAVARLVPAKLSKRAFVDSLKNAVEWFGDVMSPIDIEWTGDERNLT